MAKRSVLGWITRGLGLAVLAGGQLVFAATGASAATFNVTNGNDSGAGSLRQAFADASATAGDDTIVVDDAVNTITLTTGAVVHAPADNAALTLQGNGVTIQQNMVDARVIASGSSGLLTIDSATITGGNGTLGDGFSGGGISSGGPVALTNSTVTNNATTVSTGGGIGSNGAVTLTNSTVSNNTAAGVGGGIVATGAVTLTNSMVNGNDGGGAGGIFTTDALTVTNSTIQGNDGTVTAGISIGGALVNSATAATTLTNSTVSGNTAGTNANSAAGGLGSGGPVTIERSTIAANSVSGSPSTAAGGVGTLGGDLTATNSTVTGNTTAAASGADVGGIGGNDVTLTHSTVVENTGTDAGNVSALDSADNGSLTTFGSVIADPGSPNCVVGTDGTMSNGYNYADDTSCALVNATDNQNAANNPILGALANNGGPTQTRLPQSGSPLINAIPTAACDGAVTTDQRGIARPQGNGCDIGSVEVVPTPPPSTTSLPVCPAAQASIGAGSLLGAEGVLAVAPLGLYLLWRRRRERRSGPVTRTRLRSVALWLTAAGLSIAVLAACAPVKSPAPPGC